MKSRQERLYVNSDSDIGLSCSSSRVTQLTARSTAEVNATDALGVTSSSASVVITVNPAPSVTTPTAAPNPTDVGKAVDTKHNRFGRYSALTWLELVMAAHRSRVLLALSLNLCHNRFVHCYSERY